MDQLIMRTYNKKVKTQQMKITQTSTQRVILFEKLELDYRSSLEIVRVRAFV